jgi:hypothetical protein
VLQQLRHLGGLLRSQVQVHDQKVLEKRSIVRIWLTETVMEDSARK